MKDSQTAALIGKKIYCVKSKTPNGAPLMDLYDAENDAWHRAISLLAVSHVTETSFEVWQQCEDSEDLCTSHRIIRKIHLEEGWSMTPDSEQ